MKHWETCPACQFTTSRGVHLASNKASLLGYERVNSAMCARALPSVSCFIIKRNSNVFRRSLLHGFSISGHNCGHPASLK